MMACGTESEWVWDERASGSGRRDGAVVLVVEDGALQMRLTQMCLERAGYDVVAARDGREALEQIKHSRPDLILLDVELPEMNGFQVLETLRQDRATRDIPVIMLTAHAKDESLFGEWAGQRDAFLAKPFAPAQLIATVERALGGRIPA